MEVAAEGEGVELHPTEPSTTTPPRLTPRCVVVFVAVAVLVFVLEGVLLVVLPPPAVVSTGGWGELVLQPFAPAERVQARVRASDHTKADHTTVMFDGARAAHEAVVGEAEAEAVAVGEHEGVDEGKGGEEELGQPAGVRVPDHGNDNALTTTTTTPTTTPTPTPTPTATPHPARAGPAGGSCVQFVRTSRCDATAPTEVAHACHQAVPSTQSGFCHCTGGVVGMDCGHMPATCDELCSSFVPEADASKLPQDADDVPVCAGFHFQEGCDAFGRDDTTRKQSCDTLVPNRLAGYCDCGAGSMWYLFGCAHSRIRTCTGACKGLWMRSWRFVSGQASMEVAPATATDSATDRANSTAAPLDTRAEATSGTATSGLQYACVGWRQTGGCKASGVRESRKDSPCDEVIKGERSGFCHCSHHRRLDFDCGHPPLRCSEQCVSPSAGAAAAGGGGGGSDSSPARVSTNGGKDDPAASAPQSSQLDWSKQQCFGFYRTMGCKGDGRLEHPEPEDCFTWVEPSVSGYCECGRGRASAQQCAHHGFACSDECARLDEKLRVTNAGYEEMRQHKVVFASITRDKAAALPMTIRFVERTGAMFADYRVLVLEEDSRDSTPSILREWQGRNPRVTVDSRVEHSESSNKRGALSAQRFARLAELRNRYLRRIEGPEFAEFDFVFVFDSDLVLGWDDEGIAHSFGLLREGSKHNLSAGETRSYQYHKRVVQAQWDAVCSNSRVPAQSERYYDSLAYIDTSLDLSNFDRHQSLIHDVLEPADIVRSCFGGVTIYRKSALAGCSYGVLNPGSGKGCEHHGLHQCLADHGRRLLFNPVQVVRYKPVNKK